MSKSELLALLDEVLGKSKGTLKGDELLTSIPGWDSVAMMGYVALMHENFGIRVTGKQILGFKTVDDMIQPAGERVTE